MLKIEQREFAGQCNAPWKPFDPQTSPLSEQTVLAVLEEAPNPDCQFVTLSLNFSPFDPSWGWQYRGKQVTG